MFNPFPQIFFNIAMSRHPDENIPLVQPDWVVIFPEGFPQVKNHVLAFKFTEARA